MNARERRRAIMAVLEVAKGPVSGSALAREVGVSRQIVVQDIALLRADGHDIVATNRGYVLQEAPSSPAVPTRLVKVRHGVEQAGDELTSIVDAGGAVLNVIVNHRVYGKITADLDIRNRRDVERYLHDIESGKSFPLLTVTSGYHFHRIAAEDEQTLDEIEAVGAQGGVMTGVPTGFTLLDNKDILAANGLYYASWVSGEPQPYENSEGKTVNLYDAQLTLVVQENKTEEKAASAVSGWQELAQQNYDISDTQTLTAGGQEYTVIQFTYQDESNPYAFGVAAFGQKGTSAIEWELSCQESYTGDALAVLTEFLNGCTY